MDITRIIHRGKLDDLIQLLSSTPELFFYKDDVKSPQLGNNLIMYAVFNSHIAMIDYLVQNGVNIDEPNYVRDTFRII
jgi:hypothetical protein